MKTKHKCQCKYVTVILRKMQLSGNINTNSKRAKLWSKMLRDGLGKIGASARGQRGHLLCRWCGQSEKEGRGELGDSKNLKEIIYNI